MLRKRFVLALVAAGMALAGPAAGQAWPAKPVRVVVGFTAGGTTDILARNVGQQLGDKFKQPFVVDNKPGAGGNLGTEIAIRAPADGYTLLVASVGPIAVNPTLYPKLGHNPQADLVPIVLLADVPNVLVVHPSVPANTLEEFVAYAAANPGKLNYCSTGIGTSSHLSGFLLAKRAGLQVTHVPYKGADALNDLLSGRIQFMFATIPSVRQHIAAGSLRALAVSSAKRSRSLPEVPTVAERGYPGFRGRLVVRLLRAPGHAGRGGDHAEQSGQRDHRGAGRRGGDGQGRRRPGGQHTAAVQPIRAARVREVARGGARIGSGGRVSRRSTISRRPSRRRISSREMSRPFALPYGQGKRRFFAALAWRGGRYPVRAHTGAVGASHRLRCDARDGPRDRAPQGSRPAGPTAAFERRRIHARGFGTLLVGM